MGSIRRPINPVPNMGGGKGGGMNPNAPLRQQQMGLVPSYTPMQTMGGKGGGKGAPAPSASFNQPFPSQTGYQYLNPYIANLANRGTPPYIEYLVNNAEQESLPNPFNQGPSYGGAPAYQQPTQRPVTSPQPVTFGQPGGPAPATVGMPDGYPTRAEIERLTGLAIRPGNRQGEIDSYNRFMQNQGETTPPQGVRVPRPVAGGGPRPQPTQTSEMFGTTMARTPAEQALLTRRQAELNAMQAQQSNLAAQQEEYDKMFGGLTEEQQDFFGDQLQRPEQIPQQDQAYASFLRNQLGPSNIFSQNFLSSIFRDRVPPRNDFLGNQGLDQYGYDAQGNYLGRPPQPAFGYTKNGVQVNQIGYDQQGNYLGSPDDYYGPQQMVMRPQYDPKYDTTREDYKSPEELRLEAQKNRPQQMEELRKQMEQFQQRFNR